MMRRALGVVLLVAACSWSNSLYQARLLSGDAIRAERDRRPGDAQQLWSRAAVKAESAYARSPGGLRGAEAEWLRGRALARSGDCLNALTGLQVAFVMAPAARWREPLLLELGRCRETLSDPSAAVVFAQLVSSSDTAIRREARLRAGHFAVMEGQWSDALTMLATFETTEARIDRAKALAALHRSSAALEQLAPLVTGDTTVVWGPLVEAFAGLDTPTTDSLLARLATLPLSRANEERQSNWLLLAARGAFTYDPSAADRRITALSMRRAGGSVAEGRLLAQLRLFGNAATVGDLKAIVTANVGLGGIVLRVDVGAMRSLAEQIVGEDSLRKPSAPQGDLVSFTFAERARDSLRAPRLAAWFFARVEREWPASPYVPKALLARIMLEPDSADALRARFQSHASSQYAAFLRGQEGPNFAQLEDSLDTFAQALWRRLAVSVVPK